MTGVKPDMSQCHRSSKFKIVGKIFRRESNDEFHIRIEYEADQVKRAGYFYDLRYIAFLNTRMREHS